MIRLPFRSVIVPRLRLFFPLSSIRSLFFFYASNTLRVYNARRNFTRRSSYSGCYNHTSNESWLRINREKDEKERERRDSPGRILATDATTDAAALGADPDQGDVPGQAGQGTRVPLLQQG